MGVGLGGNIIVYHRNFSNKVLFKEAEGANQGICSRETNIQTCTGTDQMKGSSRFLR